jgi:hypothetical protein
MFHHCMRLFHASNAYIVTVHLITYMNCRLITEHHLPSTPTSCHCCAELEIWTVVLHIQHLQQLQPVSFHKKTSAQDVPDTLLRHLQFLAHTMCLCVYLWGFLIKVSRTCPTVLADGPTGKPACFVAHRQPLCWNFLYHLWTLLSVVVLWYLVWKIHCTSQMTRFWQIPIFLMPCKITIFP